MNRQSGSVVDSGCDSGTDERTVHGNHDPQNLNIPALPVPVVQPEISAVPLPDVTVLVLPSTPWLTGSDGPNSHRLWLVRVINGLAALSGS